MRVHCLDFTYHRCSIMEFVPFSLSARGYLPHSLTPHNLEERKFERGAVQERAARLFRESPSIGGWLADAHLGSRQHPQSQSFLRGY